MSEVAAGRNGGWPYRFKLIEPDLLFVDEAYQRPLTTLAKRIAKNYDEALVGSLIVSERATRKRTTYAVVDGQQRLYGMRENYEPVAPCLVYFDLSRAQEADLFARLQTERRGMATYLRFRASLVAKDPEALAIAKIATDEGFELGKTLRQYTIKSISALERAYRVSPDVLRQTLQIIAAAWPDETEPYRTSADLITGISRFLKDNPSIDVPALVAQLEQTTPRAVRHRALSLREGGAGGGGGTHGTYVGKTLVGIYAGRGR